MKRKKTSRILAIALSAILAANSFGFTAFAEDASTAGYPELETKVNEVLSQLTLRDRSYFANGVVNRNAPGQNPNVGSQTKAFPEAGLSYMSVCDGPTGVNQGGRAHTGFGSGMIIASTWNRDLTYKVGEVIGKECIAKDVQYFLGPACNINRDLINGRTFEYYSEDPYLSGQVVTPYVKGVQDQDVATTIKHYLANNQEKNRNFCSSNVSERALHEVYLPAFKEVTEEGDAWGVMTAANRMNGVFTSDNRYTMTNLLKDDYGMRGIIMTDWCNTRTDIIAAKAGLDLAMPESNGSLFAQARMEEYVRSGRLDVSYLNNLSQRLIRAGYLTKSMITTDEIDNTGYTAADRKPGEINTPENQAVARQVGEEGITLLKNQDKILPINKDEVKSIAVLGKYVDYNFYGNHGGSGVNFPPYQITNIQGLNNKLAGSDVTLNRAGYDEGNADKTIADAVEAAKKSEVAIVYAGLNSTSTNDPNVADTEDGDRGNLDFPEFQKNLINAVAQANPNTIVVLSGSMYEVRDWVDNVKGVVQTYYAGMEGGNAAADVLLGNVNPSGKLTNTWPKRYEDTQGYVPGHEGEDQRDVKYNDVWYKEGVYVGYKWNDKMGIEPEFPFGYGLSYTDFTYSNIRLSADEMGPEGTVTAMVDVTNSGDMPGKEVVQMYIHDPAAKVQRPLKELKGYEKISLDPGETKTVSFTIDKDDLCYWDVDFHSFMADAGEFQVWIGSNSEDLPMKASFNLTAGTAPDEDYQVIQAESGTDKLDTLTLSNDEVDAELTGSPKTQYLKLTNAGATAKWKVSVPQDGRYSIIVRYSNAGFNGPSANSYGPNKISALTVNGMPCGNYDFQNTRWENVWNFDSIDVELKAGENEIQITAGETAADLNIDKLIVQTLHDDYPEPAQCAPDSGDVTPPEPGEDGDVYQAENFRLESGVSAQSKYPNYTGDGYAAFEKAGSEASWDIISPTFAEGFRVAVTYANGNDTPSACDIYVNGIHYGSYYLPPTGSWGRWKTEQSPILTFRTGLNTIRIVSKDGSVSIDKLIVSGGMVDNETTPPVINATLPREGGTLTGVTGTAIAAFSEIIRESGGFANISMKDADGDAVAVSASIEGTKVLISPKSPLQYDHTYTVTIPKNAVTDEKNNQFAEDYSFSFKTPMAYIFEEDGAAIDFGGSWTADENDAYSGGRARVTSTANATANFWIDGPNAVIYGTKGPDMGIVEIKIDNGDIVRTVDLYSPEVQYQQPIVDTGSLTSGMHMITVRVTGDKNPQSYGTGFAFDYVSVVGSMAGQSLSKQGWDARSFAADDTAGGYGKPEGPAAAFDSNSSSRWVSCNMQSPGQWYMLDLGKEVNFNTLASYTPNADYIRGYRVYVSNDPSVWNNPAAAGWGSAVASGNGRQGMTTMSMGPQNARYIKIEQTGTASGNWWCVHEFDLFNHEMVDGEAPTVPEFLYTQGYNSQILVNWDASHDDIGVAGYNVYRDGVKIGTSDINAYTDGTAVNGRTYTYTAEAFDKSGKVSEMSEPVAGRTDPTLSKLPRDNWTASAFQMPPSASGLSDTPAATLDGNMNSRWTSNQGQSGDGTEWYQIDFGARIAFNKIDVYCGNAGDYMRGYKVVVSNDGIDWSEPVATGSGVPSPASTVISIPEKQIARYVRIIQTGSAPGNWWSIGETNVYMETPVLTSNTPDLVIEDGVISGSTEEMTLNGLQSMLADLGSATLRALDAQGSELPEGDYLGTDCTVQLLQGGSVVEEAKMLVMGDVNSDGRVGVIDLLQIKSMILGRDTAASELVAKAADYEKDGKVNIFDLVQIKLHILHG